MMPRNVARDRLLETERRAWARLLDAREQFDDGKRRASSLWRATKAWRDAVTAIARYEAHQRYGAVGREIAAARHALGLSQHGLATRAGISRTSVAHIEAGLGGSEEAMRAIRAALGIEGEGQALSERGAA